MRYLPVSGLPIVEENEATDEIKGFYEGMKLALGMPFVPNIGKAMAVSPHVLTACTEVFRAFYQSLTLPQALVAMISYCIPTAKNCRYCAANGELHCRSLGIDEEMLQKLAHDLGNVNPKRVQTIIQFALKCALSPQDLVREDYDLVREQGVSDEEIVELIFIASVANMADTMADGLKIEVDHAVAQALGR